MYAWLVPTTLTEEEARWIAEAHRQHLNAAQAAAKYPRSRYWFLRRGMKGSRGGQPKIDGARARALREEGLTWAQVAEKLGCSPRGATRAAHG
jgi:hypothetical protein